MAYFDITKNIFPAIEYLSNSSNNPWDMNGQAFYQARYALDDLKQEKKISTKFYMSKKYTMIAINAIYRLMDSIISEWTEAKWRSIQTYDELNTYEDAAVMLGIKRQSVYQNCYSAKWDIINKSEEDVSDLLKKLVNN